MIERDVPDEIKDMFDEFQAIMNCRDMAITTLFKARRAIFYAKKALKIHRNVWARIAEIYPDTSRGGWSYNNRTQKLFKNNGDKEAA